MIIHPISPALYIVGVLTLIITLFGYFTGTIFFDPVIGIIVFLLCNEFSKFVAEMTMKEENGTDNH